MPVFRCPTELCLVLVRTQLFDDADMPDVAAIQDAMACGRCRPSPEHAAAGAGTARPIARSTCDRRRPRAFGVLAWMLRLMPVLPEDAALRGELAARLGAGDGRASC